MDRREFLTDIVPGALAVGCGASLLSGCESDSSARSQSDTTATAGSSKSNKSEQRKDKSGNNTYDESSVAAECDPPEPVGDFPAIGEKVELSDKEWRERLTEEEFYILRESGTERRGTGELLDNKQRGTYHCAGCGAPLFSSCAKYDSNTGWPSFWRPLDERRVKLVPDKGMGMTRTEVVCAHCDGHQGHVFDDGPPPTGKRWCINSLALEFRPAESSD